MEKRAEEDALADVISEMEFNMKNHSSQVPIFWDYAKEKRAIEKVKMRGDGMLTC